MIVIDGAYKKRGCTFKLRGYPGSWRNERGESSQIMLVNRGNGRWDFVDITDSRTPPDSLVSTGIHSIATCDPN